MAGKRIKKLPEKLEIIDLEKQAPKVTKSIKVRDFEEIEYEVIRIDDDQYYQKRQNSLSVMPDYLLFFHLSRNKNGICSSYSKTYTALSFLFGKSGEYFDKYKGAFSFPFLIKFEYQETQFEYVLNVSSVRSAPEFAFAKIISSNENKYDKRIYHNAFAEFSEEKMSFFTRFFCGYLEGYLDEVLKYKKPKSFLKCIESDLILFGYENDKFFDFAFDDEDSFDKHHKKYKRLVKTKTERYPISTEV